MYGIYFAQNHANISGSTLYGGLLSVCFLNFHLNKYWWPNGDDGVDFLRAHVLQMTEGNYQSHLAQ